MYWLALFCFFATYLVPLIGIESIGVKTFHYEDKKRNRPVTVELWYPIDQDQASKVAEDDLWIHPKESREAPISAALKQYSLIMMSHGNHGDRRERSWLAETLVKANFMVASIDHFGNTRSTFHPLLSLKFWERPKDVSFALDQILKEPVLAGRIDPERIGFTGYSLGGMTGLALAGGVVEKVEHVIEKVKARMTEVSEESLKQIDFSEATSRLSDSRLRAFFLIAPANFIYSPKALKQIKAPLGVVSSVDDEVLPHKEHSYSIIQHVVPNRLRVFRNGLSHFAFLNRTTEAGKKWLPAKMCHDSSKCERSQIHQEVGEFAASFFQEILK